jgi:hypothetical protein
MRMIGGFRGLAAGLVLALLSGGAFAASPSIATTDNTAANTFLADLDSMIGRQRGDSGLHLANVNRGTSELIWFDPLKDRAQAFGYNRITYQDAEWMRSNVRLYEIYEQFGGNEIGRQQQFRVSSAGYYVGLDGFSGRWFSSNGDAQGYLFKLLIGASTEILPAVKQAVAAVSTNDIGTVLQVARDAMAANRVFVSRGSNNTLIIRGSGFGANGIAPKVVIPNGIVVGPVTYDSTEQVTVPIGVLGDAALGNRPVLLFNPGNALTPIAEYRLSVIRGSGTPTAPTDDHAATTTGATTLTIGTSIAGHIGTGSDVDVFRIVVGSPGTLTLESGGTSDVGGELLNSSGGLIAADEDGGSTWYNFRIQQAVAPGTYYLRVRHCCDGSGGYFISSSLN